MTATTKELVRSSFTERAAGWMACYRAPNASSLEQRNLLSRQRVTISLLERAIQPPAAVLDAGCGSGDTAGKLMNRGYEVRGVDIAEGMIELARMQFGDEHFQVGDIEHLPFTDNSFDAVVCLGVLEYLDADAGALREIRRVLKNRGVAILATPNAGSILQWLDRLLLALRPAFRLVKYTLRGRRLPPADDAPAVRSRKYPLRKWLRTLRENGFECETAVCHGWGWYRSPLSKAALLLSRSSIDYPLQAPLRNWIFAEHILRVRALK